MTRSNPNLRHSDALSYWSALKKGNATALESIYQLYSNPLYNYGSKFTRDKELVKECIQELFVHIWSKKEGLGDPKDVKNYLFKSFRHLIFKKTTALHQHIDIDTAENYVFEASLNMEETMISFENDEAIKEQLQQTINELTSRQKEAIFLKFYENLSYEEIAGVMGISVKATYKLMARSLTFLRGSLSKSDFFLLIFFLDSKLFH
jgi:RNA polymerase sigma factor (sigma-70 family)